MLIAHVLGSGSGRPSARRDTTSLLVGGVGGWTLVDCPGGVVHKLARLGLEPEDLARVILTHDHVDHIYGLAHLLHALAIGRQASAIEVHAPEETLGTVAALQSALRLDRGGYPHIQARPAPLRSGHVICDTPDGRILSGPAVHGRDSLAVRFEVDGAALAHTGDSRPGPSLIEIGRDADLLIHDCGGLHERVAEFGADHASARQAGETATAAGARALALIHLGRTAERDEGALVADAAESFDGPVSVLVDGQILRLPS